MKIFRKSFPYCLIFTAFVLLCADSPKPKNAQSETTKQPQFNFDSDLHVETCAEFDYDLHTNQFIDYKVQLLMDTYIDNAIAGTKRIIANKKKKGYAKSVQMELPGAPRNKEQGALHCLYGQYTQLNRALAQLNDTIHIIPTKDNAHQSSLSFKCHMTKMYDNPKYSGAIYRGHLYATGKEYSRALNKYLKSKMHKRTDNTDSLRAVHTANFKKNNYCATMLNPGSIIIVNSGHAIMYLGQGHIKNNEFIPNPNGTAICCAYNSEHPAVELKTWKTSKSFAADINIIATKKYEQARADSLIYAEYANKYVMAATNTTYYPFHQR